MWNRDPSAKMASRSNVGSADDKSPDATDDSLVQKCVVLQRDQHGYGLTVAGDSPTYVQLVKENGAAARAGIQRGDKILKVNGTLVTHCSHSEVSNLLKFGSYVNLTLLGRLNPGGQLVTLRNLEELKENREGSSSPMLSDKETDISNPKKVDASKASHYHMQKVMTMKMMQKQIREELEHMKLEYDSCPSDQLCLRLEAKKQMLDKVQEQLNSLQVSHFHSYEAEIMPKRPSSAGHDLSDMDSEGSKTQFPGATPPTTRHKKSDSMPEALYKMSGVKRQSTQSESKVVEALVEERGALGSLEGRSRGGQSSYFGEAGKGVRSYAESPPDIRQSPGTSSTSPYQARSISSMIRKRCLKVVLPSQVKMGTVEDSDFSTLEDPSIFTDLEQLKCHPAHLSVFLHYVMPNFDPSPMLFHIVTESYSQGSSKEMRKWAYEIYSTFLHEKSPLRVNVDDELVSEVESTLSTKHEDEDVMRNVFLPARNCLTNEILNQLADFRAKRASGLGSIYGDQELRDVMDKNTELRIIENGLWKYFERLSMNKNNDRCKALASALATFFKGVGLSSSKISSTLERCYTFNAKDKKTFRFKTNKKLINGHQYVAQQYFVPTYCHWCHQLFWGIGHQGFQCSHCEMNLHKNCIEQMKESCPGGTLKKRKDKKNSPSVFDKIISRKISANNNPLFVKEAQHMHEALPFASPTFVAGFSTPTIHTTAPLLNGENEETEHSKNKRSSSQDPHPEQRVKVHESSFEVTPDLLNPSSTIGSETVHAKLDSKINIRRAHSDVTPENQPTQPQLSDSSGCSSNSSLSAKSSEIQGGLQPEGDQNLHAIPSPGINSLLHPLQGQHSFSSFSNQTSHLQQHPFISHSLSSLVVQPLHKHQHLLGSISDSDFEVDSELPSIESHVPKEQLKKLKPKERKRQEVINELFHTEQAHVRNLKVMYRIFYQPMLEEPSVPRDLIDLVFPNLKGLIDCHCSLNEEFKAIRKSENIIGDFAHVLVEQFSGEEGENLKLMASTFCQNQSHCLEVLRVRQRKDAKFAAFLQEAASHPLCRRLELKDLIPTEMQRLTKYPLLIENLLKYTQTNTKEYEVLLRSLECSKSILSHVDQRVKECENLQKLSDLQRRLDTKPIENSTHPVLAEYKKLDLRRHKMVYDGPLTWRICKTKQLEMHAVLLEDILVLLQKSQDSEKLFLRCPNSNVSVANTNPLVGGAGATGTIGKDDSKTTHSPIVKLTNILLRNVATDKKAFFLVSISEFGPQIYEFVATTRDEKNRWFRYITEASENYKHLQGITDKSITPSCLKGYMSGNNVVTTGGQEAETVQPSRVLPLLSSSISSIIPDDVAQLKVAKVDPSFHHLKGAQAEQTVLREVRSRSRSRSCESDSDGQEVTSEENIATVMIVESDGPDEGCLVQPNEVKVSTMKVLERQVPRDDAMLPSPNVIRDINCELSQVMREKKQIVSSILGIPLEEYDNFAEIAEEEAEHSTDVKELLLALLAQTDHLMGLVNDRVDCAGAVPYSSPSEKKLPETSLRLSRMVTIPSSQILGISTKLNHLLLQLMEVLIQQERNSSAVDRVTEESQTEPHSLAQHSTNQEPQYVQDHAPYFQKPIITPSPMRLPAYIEKSCIASLKATVVDSPRLETGHVLTTSVNSLFCGAEPEMKSTPSPLSSQIFATIGSSNNNNTVHADDGNNNNGRVFVVPPTTIYTSTCQLPRLVESQQPIRRSSEDRGVDDGRSPPPAERALTVL